MTEAQKAHLRILENTPRERVRTHEASPPGEQGARPPHAVSARRREWIKAHHGTMTQDEMADYLKIARGSVRKHLIALKIIKTSGRRGRPRKNKNG